MSRGPAVAALAAAIMILPAFSAAARGPENISNVAEQVSNTAVFCVPDSYVLLASQPRPRTGPRRPRADSGPR